MVATIIRKSSVKDEAGKYRVSADFYEALNKEVLGTLKKAQKRADANGRKTLRPEDL